MKILAVFLVFNFAICSNAMASAVCSSGGASVVIGDYQSIKVSGLEEKGIKNGTYSCVVTSVMPGFFSKQSSIQCTKNGSSNQVILGWMIEGLNMFGMNAASAALYFQGNKVFEAGCVRQ